ncbi:hypothetical protein I0P04_001900 [Staphylococcus pseudintermedius]|nr:hypothetical protein [Staphylococcus pseudintermedius]HDU1417137.1 hypothetical protein [Staphylococcus pseudintermedius]
MTEINHRYLKDRDGENFFPVTHADAVLGLDTESTNSAIGDVNDKVQQLESTVSILSKKLNNLISDTGWIDIQIDRNNKNNAISNGFDSGVRTININSIKVKSIRLNVSNITGSNMQIAQLPTGFITDNQSFIARQNGYRHPITIECTKEGKVMAFMHPDDQSKNNWVYQEFTFLD